MRPSSKPRGGSAEDADAMVRDAVMREGFRSIASSLHSNISEEKERLDEAGNPILGGELLVKIVDAQVSLAQLSLHSNASHLCINTWLDVRKVYMYSQ